MRARAAASAWPAATVAAAGPVPNVVGGRTTPSGTTGSVQPRLQLHRLPAPLARSGREPAGPGGQVLAFGKTGRAAGGGAVVGRGRHRIPGLL